MVYKKASLLTTPDFLLEEIRSLRAACMRLLLLWFFCCFKDTAIIVYRGLGSQASHGGLRLVNAGARHILRNGPCVGVFRIKGIRKVSFLLLGQVLVTLHLYAQTDRERGRGQVAWGCGAAVLSRFNTNHPFFACAISLPFGQPSAIAFDHVTLSKTCSRLLRHSGYLSGPRM